MSFENLSLLRSGVDHTVSFPAEGGRVMARFRPASKAKVLVIYFHGAVDRKVRSLPVFIPFHDLQDAAHQISFSDPTLEKDHGQELGLAWFAGCTGFSAQEVIFEIIAQIKHDLGVSRLIFVGGSAGAFPALFFSSKFHESGVLVTNPHAIISNYYSGHVKRYLNTCWPSLPDLKSISDFAVVDLRNVYGAPVKNTILLMQGSLDPFHIYGQYLPFLSGLSEVNRANVIPIVGYWGRVGHSHSVVKDAYFPWLNSLIASPTLKVPDVLKTFDVISAPLTPREKLEVAQGGKDERLNGKSLSTNAVDLSMADLLRNLQLNS